MKPKYTLQLKQEIYELLKIGNLKKDVCHLVGISEETFYSWQRPLLPDGKTPNPDYKPDLIELVEKAISEYKQTLLKAVHVGMVKHGTIALEVLSRRWPEDWAGKQKVEIETGNDRIQRVLDLIEESKKGEQVSDNSK